MLENVVKLCSIAGLVGGKECAVDSTLIKANASSSNLKHGETGEGTRHYVARLKREHPSTKPRVTNSDFISLTDPDARLATKPSAPTDLYYKATHVTDSKSQIILSAGCSRADVHDTHCAGDPLKRASNTLKKSKMALHRVVGDSGYDDGNFHAFVESLNAIPITNNYPRNRKDQIPKSDFRYDPERDVYICPVGHHLRRIRQEESRSQYESNPQVCKGCPFKSGCIARGESRTIARYPNEDARIRNIERSKTREGRNALSRRKQVVEPPFAHMKQYGGLRRLNCRTLKRATVKILCAAIAWNLKKLAAGLRVATGALKRHLQAEFRLLATLFNRLNRFTRSPTDRRAA